MAGPIQEKYLEMIDYLINHRNVVKSTVDKLRNDYRKIKQLQWEEHEYLQQKYKTENEKFQFEQQAKFEKQADFDKQDDFAKEILNVENGIMNCKVKIPFLKNEIEEALNLLQNLEDEYDQQISK